MPPLTQIVTVDIRDFRFDIDIRINRPRMRLVGKQITIDEMILKIGRLRLANRRRSRRPRFACCM